MSTQGWFNHYDDPDDDYWDDPAQASSGRRIETAVRHREQPVERTSEVAHLPATANENISDQRHSTIASTDISSRAESTVTGTGLITMKLDSDNLPTEVHVDRNIHYRISATGYSEAATTGYQLAIWDRAIPLLQRGGALSDLRSQQSRRLQMISLLETGSLQEFETLEDSFAGRSTFRADGPITHTGAPSMVLYANLSWIARIEISEEWAAQADPWHLAADIISCAKYIREQRPKYSQSSTWAIHSDNDLESELRKYRDYLKGSK